MRPENLKLGSEVNERLKVLKVVKVKECERVTFEHRYENKNCSVC